MALRTIIDDTGLPEAGGYYETFRREPSPAGHLVLTAPTTVRLPGITLQAILDEMAKVGANGEILLVCHGTRDGLVLPVVQGGTDAVADALDVIREADAAEARADVIRAMPEKTKEEQGKKRDQWFELVNSLRPGALFGVVTLEEAAGQYEKWFASEASRLRTSAASLRSLCARRRRVLALNLERLEIRACNAGGSPPTMLAFKRFFGCKKVLAPKFETFFHSRVTIQVIETGPFMVGISMFGRFGVSVKNPALAEIFEPTENAPLGPPGSRGTSPGPIRKLPPLPAIPPAIAAAEREIMSNGALRPFGSFVGIALRETPRFRYRALILTKVPPWVRRPPPGQADPQPDWPTMQAFVSEFIMQSSGYSTGRFPIAGFANTNQSETPFLMPNETGYVEAIVTLQ